MVDLHSFVDSIGSGLAILRNHVPADKWPANPTVWAAAAIPAGLILALWGARLLRALCVVTFLVIGAAIGVQFAGVGQIDKMVGLFLGAGLAALVGHLFFRWWVGMLAGFCATLIVVAVSLPQVSQEIQAFTDYRSGVSTGQIVLQPPGEGIDPERFMSDLRTFLFQHRRDFLLRTGFIIGLADLLGLGIGILLPRLTMIVGTSSLGVLMAAIGCSVLLSSRLPDAWATVLAHPSWTLGALGVLLLGSVLFQARRRRVAPAPVEPVPATA